jgi:Skp family chaperone for outer membrane proteins
MPSNLNIRIKSITDAKQGDILYHDGFNWVPISIEKVFQELQAKIQSIKDELESTKIALASTREQLQQEINSQRQAIAELLKGIVK